jgi:hypothetical protein
MKIRFLILICFVTILLSSCPGVYDVPNYFSCINTRESALIPGETVSVYCVDSNQDEGEWKHLVGFPHNVLYALEFDDNVCCEYGRYSSAKEVKPVSAKETVYEVPINIAINPTLHYNYEDELSVKRVIYPAIGVLSESEAHIGDEIQITLSKPIFDVATFSQDKLKKLSEIEYYPIRLPERKDYVVSSYLGIAINDCVITDPYHIKFTIPQGAISGQVLIMNEGGFEDWIDTNHPKADELRQKYINFNSTSCEKYAYYASRTELLILDASGDRVD